MIVPWITYDPENPLKRQELKPKNRRIIIFGKPIPNQTLFKKPSQLHPIFACGCSVVGEHPLYLHRPS